MQQIFLLSPARSDGERAQLLLRDAAAFPLAVKLRDGAGAPIGEVYSFLSGLYFRGKLAYSRAFARPPNGLPGVLVITPTRGLMPPDVPITTADVRAFASLDIARGDARFREPLTRDLDVIARAVGRKRCRFVLLGSIATQKYAELLVARVGERAVFPSAFVGRGDMSRGGLLLRCARAGEELEMIPIAQAVRHGPRPPKLPPLRRV